MSENDATYTQKIINGLIVIFLMVGGTTLILRENTDNPNYKQCRFGNTYGKWIPISKIYEVSDFAPKLGQYRCDLEKYTGDPLWCRDVTATRCYHLDAFNLSKYDKLLDSQLVDDLIYTLTTSEFDVLKLNSGELVFGNSSITFDLHNLLELRDSKDPHGNVKFGFKNRGSFEVDNVIRVEEATTGIQMVLEDVPCDRLHGSRGRTATCPIGVTANPAEDAEGRSLLDWTYDPKTKKAVTTFDLDNYDPAVGAASSASTREDQTAWKDSSGNYWKFIIDNSNDIMIYQSTDEGDTWSFIDEPDSSTNGNVHGLITDTKQFICAYSSESSHQLWCDWSDDNWTTDNYEMIGNGIIDTYGCRWSYGVRAVSDSDGNVHVVALSDRCKNEAGSDDYNRDYIGYWIFNETDDTWYLSNVNQTSQYMVTTEGSCDYIDITATSHDVYVLAGCSGYTNGIEIWQKTNGWGAANRHEIDNNGGFVTLFADSRDHLWALYKIYGELIIANTSEENWDGTWTITYTGYLTDNERASMTETQSGNLFVMFSYQNATIAHIISEDYGATWNDAVVDIEWNTTNTAGSHLAYSNNVLPTFSLPTDKIGYTYYNYSDDMEWFRTALSTNPPSDPTDVSCDGGSCNETFTGTISFNCTGSIDPEDDAINYTISVRNSTLGNYTGGDLLIEEDSEDATYSNWTQGSGDVFDWTLNDCDGTPSPYTGPQDGNGAEGSDCYTYVEVSGIGANKYADLVSSSIDLDIYKYINLSYWRHRYSGDVYLNMGPLEVYISNGTGWTLLKEYTSNNEGDTWFFDNVTVDVGDYPGTHQFKFRAYSGTDVTNYWCSDNAIDNINVTSVDGTIIYTTWTSLGDHIENGVVLWDISEEEEGKEYDQVKCVAWDPTGSGLTSGEYIEAVGIVISTGEPPEEEVDFNISFAKAGVTTEWYKPRNSTDVSCIPPNTGNPQYTICNNGSIDITEVTAKVNATLAGWVLAYDDDETCAGSVNLTTSYQSIYSGSLTAGSCFNISGFMYLENPTTPYYFYTEFNASG